MMAALPALSSEPIQVWLAPEYISNAKELGQRITAASKIGLEPAEARWAATRARDLSYVLDQFTVGILDTDCDMEPVAVRVVKGEVVSATYTGVDGRCKKGADASYPRYSQQILTPKDIFEVAKRSIAENPPCGVNVKYDAATGLPILIEGGCWYILDTYWAIKVRDIRIVEMTPNTSLEQARGR
jgi:hypothetical protein